MGYVAKWMNKMDIANVKKDYTLVLLNPKNIQTRGKVQMFQNPMGEFRGFLIDKRQLPTQQA